LAQDIVIADSEGGWSLLQLHGKTTVKMTYTAEQRDGDKLEIERTRESGRD